MADMGLNLVYTNGIRYEFERGTPGEYEYRIQLLGDMPKSEKGREYISLVEETGAEYVASYVRWVYFRKKREAGPFVLFSDIDSRISHFRKILAIALPLMAAEVLIGISNKLIYLNRGMTISAAVGGLSLFLGCLFTVAVIMVSRQIRRLKRERDITE